MSASDLLTHITRVSFVALGLLAVGDYLRHRDRTRRDIALAFGSLALPVAIPILTSLLSLQVPWLNSVGVLVLVAQPYLLLRLVCYFQPIPSIMRTIALGGMVLSWGALPLFLPKLPLLLTVAIIAYFICVDGYAMLAFVQGAFSSQGVVRQRLRFAALGSGLLAGALFLSSVRLVLPSFLSDLIAVLAQVVAALSAFAFYIGFTPPRWLRQAWQLAEFRAFLLEITGKPTVERQNTSETLHVLCRFAQQAVGGIGAAIAQQDEPENQWMILHATNLPMLSGFSCGLEDIVTREQPQILTRTSAHLDATSKSLLDVVGAETLFAVPIATNTRKWGILLLFPRYHSLFVEDDLSLLGLLAQQSAIILENNALFEDLSRKNEQLEQKAVQLSAVNRELEAFSYSVSHDLRAPLRALDGFSRILLEDYVAKLDDEGQSCLQRIRTASQRMGQLIDDLLQLSRLARTDLQPQPVDLSVLVQEISAELREREPDRQVEMIIKDGLLSQGDPRLLRVMLMNLLANAWKFTSKTLDARIEFGVTQQNGQRAFFVRDNGAGFDMTYAGKLFGAFQRLHGATEFEGIGVGLATVQRIVHRHGGEISAEGIVNQGATFYFTL
jgi:signal transduction histidine kinase